MEDQQAAKIVVKQEIEYLECLLRPVTNVTTAGKTMFEAALDRYTRRQVNKSRSFHKSAYQYALILQQADAGNPLAVEFLKLEGKS